MFIVSPSCSVYYSKRCHHLRQYNSFSNIVFTFVYRPNSCPSPQSGFHITARYIDYRDINTTTRFTFATSDEAVPMKHTAFLGHSSPIEVKAKHQLLSLDRVKPGSVQVWQSPFPVIQQLCRFPSVWTCGPTNNGVNSSPSSNIVTEACKSITYEHG